MVEFALRLAQRHAGQEARRGIEVGRAVRDLLRRVSGRSGELRQPDVDVAVRIIEARRHDADERAGRSVERERATEGVGAALEEPLPEPFGDHRDRPRADFVLVSEERATFERADAEDGEEIRRDALGREALGLRDAGERDRGVVGAAHLAERALALPEVVEAHEG